MTILLLSCVVQWGQVDLFISKFFFALVLFVSRESYCRHYPHSSSKHLGVQTKQTSHFPSTQKEGCKRGIADPCVCGCVTLEKKDTLLY
ncbi:MAG: hypothetical protein J3R72DRAFT_428771 [Linnemannia gamsii]|nr:MAG: hypothetical protein J3R72DRAFT_428771 [Linnemannia gamsii]